METQIKKNSFYFFIGLILSFASCDSTGVFDQYKSISSSGWNQKEPVRFEFSVADTISKNSLFINLRNNKTYSYSNLYVITQLDFPNGKVIVDTLQYEMADASGKFLGTGISDVKENKLFYKENVQFPVSGEYSIQISQAMRESAEVTGIKFLEGITDVGFRIEKN